MQFDEVTTDKKQYLDLLLLADEQEDMIERYLPRAWLFTLTDGGEVVCVCAVVQETADVAEIKNIAVLPKKQRQGYGSRMLAYVCNAWRGKACVMQVGTGDVPATVGFYERNGFRYSHRVKDFFTDNYDHPIVEDGILLRDMVYLQRQLG